MQYTVDAEDLSATSGDESDQEDEADAHVAVADGDEANQEEAGADTDQDKEEEAGSDPADDVEAGSDADADFEEDEANVRAAGTQADGNGDDDEAADADEEVYADPADNRRANLVVAASLLLAAIVTVTATIYAPPPPVTPSAHQQGLIPAAFPTGDVAFSTIHKFPRGGTAIANDNNKKLNDFNPISINFQVGVGPGDDNQCHPSALLRRFISVVFTSFLHVLYFWHLFGVLDLVLLPLVWVLMGIILYHG